MKNPSWEEFKRVCRAIQEGMQFAVDLVNDPKPLEFWKFATLFERLLGKDIDEIHAFLLAAANTLTVENRNQDQTYYYRLGTETFANKVQREEQTVRTPIDAFWLADSRLDLDAENNTSAFFKGLTCFRNVIITIYLLKGKDSRKS